MVLPPGPSPSEVFQASLDRCVADPSFLARFYHRFQATNAMAAAHFAHVDMARQERVLRASLYMILRAAQGSEDGLLHLTEIAASHSKKGHDIGPAEYGHWLDSLLEAVRECDPDCSDATLGAWRACIQPCVDVMIARYDALK
jgi:hypothetical protein